MARVEDVASFFIEAGNNRAENDMTNMRLNKLLYFAQVWNLFETGTPLFADEIQAWKFGPVVPSVYDHFKVPMCGNDFFISSGYEDYDPTRFTSEEITLLTDVDTYYKDFSSSKLVDMTHVEDGPWAQVFSERKRHSVIENNAIIEYYKARVEKLPRVSKEIVCKLPVIRPKRASDGTAVFSRTAIDD